MSRLYTSQHSHVSLPKGTVMYVTRVPEAVTIMVEIYQGPKWQKDIVKNTGIAGNRVKSILSQLCSRGMLIKSRGSSMTYKYDLTVIAKLWMLQNHRDQLSSKTGVAL